ncbi:MAG: sensor histidine kinase, partial [Marinobacter sp.]
MTQSQRLRRLPIAMRMLVSALILVVLVLPVAGALLSWNFREAVNTAFNERLESLLNVVIAGVSYDVRQDALVSNRQLGDSRFDR